MQIFIQAAPIIEIFNRFYNSATLEFIKFFLMVYTVVLLVDLFLLLFFKGVRSDIRKGLMGTDMPVIARGKMEKRWDKVKERLRTGNLSQYKVAIIEADSVVDEILGKIGHGGGNMSEKLEQLKPGQLDYQEELLAAHKIRNRIIHDDSFVIDEELARKTIAIYERFLKYLEFM